MVCVVCLYDNQHTHIMISNQPIETLYNDIISSLFDNFKLSVIKDKNGLRMNFLRAYLSGEIPMFRETNTGSDKYRLLSSYLFSLQILVDNATNNDISASMYMTLKRDLKDLLDDLLLNDIADKCEKLLHIIDTTRKFSKDIITTNNEYYKLPGNYRRSIENIRFTRGIKRGYLGIRLPPSMLIPSSSVYEGRLPANTSLQNSEKRVFVDAFRTKERIEEEKPLIVPSLVNELKDIPVDSSIPLKATVPWTETFELTSKLTTASESEPTTSMEEKQSLLSIEPKIVIEEDPKDRRAIVISSIPLKVDCSTPFTSNYVEMNLSDIIKLHRGYYIRGLIKNGPKIGQCCLISKEFNTDDNKRILVRFNRGDEYLEFNTKLRVHKYDINH